MSLGSPSHLYLGISLICHQLKRNVPRDCLLDARQSFGGKHVQPIYRTTYCVNPWNSFVSEALQRAGGRDPPSGKERMNLPEAADSFLTVLCRLPTATLMAESWSRMSSAPVRCSRDVSTLRSTASRCSSCLEGPGR